MGKRTEQPFFQRRQTNDQQVHKKMFNVTNHQGNANQNDNVVLPHTCQMTIIKNQEIISLGKDVEQSVPFCPVGGKQYRGSSKNLKNRTTI